MTKVVIGAGKALDIQHGVRGLSVHVSGLEGYPSFFIQWAEVDNVIKALQEERDEAIRYNGGKDEFEVYNGATVEKIVIKNS